MPEEMTPPDRRWSVRLAAAPVSVPGARRLVRDGLREWGREHLVDDAALCVTELAANAALHSGSRFMDVLLHDLGGPVEVAVLDDGAATEEAAVTPRSSPAMDVRQSRPPLATEPATGRGLAIVAVLAQRWGVTDDAGRRKVWAVLSPEGDADVDHVPPRRLAAQPDVDPDLLPDGWRLVVVPDAPVALSVRIDQHIDDVIRELQLVDASPTSPTAELAALIQQLISVPFARHRARIQGLVAAEQGRERFDVQLPMPREAAPHVRSLLEAMREADRLCAEHQLLGVPATREMDLLREWYTHNMVTQLETDADPIGYDAWLAARGLNAG